MVQNTFLEKVELEGNLIGPKTAYELGELLKFNKVIRYLDLEFNNLTASGTNVDGIKNIAEVILINIYLNNF